MLRLGFLTGGKLVKSSDEGTLEEEEAEPVEEPVTIMFEVSVGYVVGYRIAVGFVHPVEDKLGLGVINTVGGKDDSEDTYGLGVEDPIGPKSITVGDGFEVVYCDVCWLYKGDGEEGEYCEEDEY